MVVRGGIASREIKNLINSKEVVVQEVNRRTFIKQAGGILLPVVAGLPLIAKAQLNQGLPRNGSFATPDGSVSLFYFLDSSKGKLRGPGSNWVEYGSVSANGNTIYLSSARPGFDGAQIPSNCREISLTILEYTKGDDIDAVILSEFLMATGKAQLRLADGTVYSMIVSTGGGGCFLTTACTAARGLPDDCIELQTLRAFRDGYMKQQASDGMAMIKEYYKTAPAVVAAINARDDAPEIYDWMYRDLVLPSVQHIERDQNARALDHYAGFFQCLASIAW
jgi:hypothetical protein